MDEIREFIIVKMKDLMDYDGNISDEFGDKFFYDGLTTNFLLSMYISINVVQLSSEYIINSKTKLRAVEDIDVENIDYDSKIIHKFMFDLHRDSCFREIFLKSDDIIELLLNDSEINVIQSLVNFVNNMYELFIQSTVKSGINVANRSTESIFSIIIQSILDSHRAASSKATSSANEVTGTIQGITPKNQLFRFKHSTIKTKNDAINFLTTKITGITFNDILIEFDLYDSEKIKAMDIWDIYHTEKYDSLLITIDLEKQAIYGISFDTVIEAIRANFSKTITNVRSIEVFYEDEKIQIPHVRIIVMFEIKSIKTKVKKNLLKHISGIKVESKITSDIEDEVANTEVSININVNISDYARDRVATDKMHIDYLKSVMKNKRNMINKISDEISSNEFGSYEKSSWNTFNKYIVAHIMDMIKTTNISGVKDSEMADFSINNFHDQIKEVCIINDREFILVIDSMEYKLNGFFKPENVTDYLPNDVHFVKVGCTRFIIDNIELYMEKLSKILDILSSKTIFSQNIHVYGNSILFYPYIENNLISRFRQTIINMKFVTEYMEEIIYFEQKYLIKFDNNFEDNFKHPETISKILFSLGKDYLDIVDEHTSIKFTQHTEYNKTMEYGKFFIISNYIDIHRDDLTKQLNKFIIYDPNKIVTKLEFDEWILDYSKDIRSNILSSEEDISLLILDSLEIILQLRYVDKSNTFYDILDRIYPSLLELDVLHQDMITKHRNDIITKMTMYLSEQLEYLYSINTDIAVKYAEVGIISMCEVLESFLDISVKDVISVLYNTSMKNIINSIRDRVINSDRNTDDKFIELKILSKLINNDTIDKLIDFRIKLRDKYLDVFRITEDFIDIIVENISLSIDKDKDNILSLIKSYDINTCLMSAYNGKISDYIKIIDNKSYIMYQDVDNISQTHGIVSADQAYYQNIIGFIINSGMNISAIHIEVRSALMTYDGTYINISPFSVSSQPNALYASIRDPALTFTKRCLKPIHRVPSDDIIFGSAPTLGNTLKYTVKCKDDTDCSNPFFTDYSIESDCANCNNRYAETNFSDEYMNVDINTSSNTPYYHGSFDERYSDPGSWNPQDLGSTVSEYVEIPDEYYYGEENPFSMYDIPY